MSSLRRTAATVLGMLMLAAGCATGPSPGGPADGGSGSPSAPTVVRISAASDLKFALEDIKTDYTKAHPNVDVQLTFGSSGNFTSRSATGHRSICSFQPTSASPASWSTKAWPPKRTCSPMPWGVW